MRVVRMGIKRIIEFGTKGFDGVRSGGLKVSLFQGKSR
jgi:hypothetical protein